jgi:hypothetical protein
MKTETAAFLSHQEIFDRAAMHLLQQGQAGLLQRGDGAYRGYAGGCPVGNPIQPRDYSTTIEGGTCSLSRKAHIDARAAGRLSARRRHHPCMRGFCLMHMQVIRNPSCSSRRRVPCPVLMYA